MSIVRFNNRALKSAFPSFFDDFFFDDVFPSSQSVTTNGTLPATNVEETDKEFKLNMAIPGMDKDDINVEVENGMLCVSAEKEESSEEEDKNYTRKEFSYNSFKRSFTLPENVSGSVTAKYDAGVLSITLPKKEVEISQAKKIKVA